MAKKLLRLGVSVMVKVNSFIPEIQDTIVGSKGFTKDKDECLRRLLDTGFNKTNPTRLGLETSIMRTSPGELMEIYKLGSMLNMYINLNCFMPCGLTKNNKLTKRFDISRKDKFDLFKKVYKFNIDFGIPFRDVSPFAGGDPCSHLGYGLYVNSRGYAFCCCSGDDCIGHIRKNTIKQIWAKNPYKRKYKGCLSHGCPFRDKSNVMIDDWENKLRRYIQKEMDQKKWMKELYL